jgi:sugar porter (SP) family MFS transporter
MAPFNLRGALNIMFQLAVTIGILGAQLINYGTQYIQPWGWRLSLAIGAVPALVVLVGSLILPETPNSLVQRGRFDEGRKVLQKIRGVDDVDMEFDDITDAAEEAAKMPSAMRLIVGRGYRPQLAICVLIPIFQQFTGINAIMFYAPQLFESMGHGSDTALLSTVIIGAVNVVCTIVAIVMVDRAGRKALFIQGGSQMIICEIIVGVLVYHSFMPQHATNEAMKAASIAFICLFVAGFAWSWGPLGWLVPAEVNPIETRSAGCAINTFVNFITTFVIGQFFLSMLCTMQWGVFLFFAGMVLLATLFVIFFIPETKGVPIETLNEVSFAKHWFWKRMVHVHQQRHSVHSLPHGDGAAEAGLVAGAGGDANAGVVKSVV